MISLSYYWFEPTPKMKNESRTLNQSIPRRDTFVNSKALDYGNALGTSELTLIP